MKTIAIAAIALTTITACDTQSVEHFFGAVNPVPSPSKPVMEELAERRPDRLPDLGPQGINDGSAKECNQRAPISISGHWVWDLKNHICYWKEWQMSALHKNHEGP